MIVLSALLLAFMPLTEHCWTFDRFLRGGSDLELGLLCLVALLCLVVLLARHTQQELSLVMAWREWLRFRFLKDDAATSSRPLNALRASWNLSRPMSSLRLYTLPLLV